jgi:UDP-N-acetyl-2-amino-2-deoxyglucuronate dehydrogenase
MTAAPIRIGLIGCGRISDRHIEVLTNLESARLVGVTDIIKDRAEAKAGKKGIPVYTSLDELIEKGKPEIISILTPSGDHPERAIEVAARGVHVIVEKPMALRLDDADRMIDACDRAGVKLFVVKQNRYNLPVQELRKAIDRGRFGKLVLGTVRVRWCREQKYYDQDAWRGTWAMDGGVLSNQASHHIDLLHWMMGPVETVMAMSATQLVNIEVDDTAVAVLKFASGALGVIEATTATRPKDLEGAISILGEKGSVEVGGFAVNEIRHWNFTAPEEGDAAILSNARSNPPNVYGFGHREFYKAVIENLTTGKRENSLVDGLEGKRSLELINAIYESVETGKAVELMFRPRWSRMGRSS